MRAFPLALPASVFLFGLFAALFGYVGSALAVESAHPLGFPSPVGPVAESATEAYNFIFWISAAIFVFVQAILLIAIWRFRRSRRTKVEGKSHNVPLEIVWTTIPAIICVAIAWKSYDSLMFMRTMPDKGLTVEVISYQFGWDFDYPDFAVSAPEPLEQHAMLSSAGSPRYVKDLVVPVDTVVKLHVTSRDVIHAFYVPQLGIKIDAMPGRINYQWFKADETGDFIGQCAELCGSAHSEMFFNVKVVSQDTWLNWLNDRRTEEGTDPVTREDFEAVL